MSKFYIIGNGFDINHGLQSRYSDFLQYVCEYHHDMFHRIGAMFGEGNPSFLWQDFENNLINFNVNRSIMNNIYRLMNHARQKPERAFDLYTSLENACDGLFNDIGLLFREWIHDTLVNRNVGSKYELSNEDYYLTFNYTNILSSTYNIPFSHICHIHHNLCYNDNMMPIFGHGALEEEIEERVGLNEDATNEIIACGANPEEIKDIYITLFRDFKKNTEEGLEMLTNFIHDINNDDVEEILILGHSMGTSDKPYFDLLAERIAPQTQIYISYYNEQERHSLFQKVEELFNYPERINLARMDNLLPHA